MYSHGCCSIELNVTISAPGEDPEELGPNEFTAGSALSLDCTVQGDSGSLTYDWSIAGNSTNSDCTKCNIDLSPNTPTLVLGHPALNSYFAGVYTCTVSESGRPDSGNSDNFTVTVVGKFVCIYTQYVYVILFQVLVYMLPIEMTSLRSMPKVP